MFPKEHSLVGCVNDDHVLSQPRSIQIIQYSPQLFRQAEHQLFGGRFYIRMVPRGSGYRGMVQVQLSGDILNGDLFFLHTRFSFSSPLYFNRQLLSTRLTKPIGDLAPARREHHFSIAPNRKAKK